MNWCGSVCTFDMITVFLCGWERHSVFFCPVIFTPLFFIFCLWGLLGKVGIDILLRKGMEGGATKEEEREGRG